MSGYPGLGRITDPATNAVCKQLFDLVAQLQRRITALETDALRRGSPFDAEGARITDVAPPEDISDVVTLAYLRGYVAAQLALAGLTTAIAGTITVDPAGALDGDGSPSAPLAVKVDGVTINISGDQLVAVAGTGAPAGANQQVQFNDGGAFGADAGLVYDKATDTLSLAGVFRVGPTPAAGQGLRLTYAYGMTIRNRLNTADVGLLGIGLVADDDFIELGDNSQHGVGIPLGVKIYAGAGSPALTALTNGNVGISTVVPNVKLEIAGTTADTETLRLTGLPKFAGTNTTGAGLAGLGANSPAATLTQPYIWIKALSSDGSTVYIPCWK